MSRRTPPSVIRFLARSRTAASRTVEQGLSMPMPQPAPRRTAARTASLTSLLCVSGPLLLLASTEAQA
ncbi:cytochrome C, partial [Xanthomonas perforans]|nr:cytochrome C [Xanthomonas perforans]